VTCRRLILTIAVGFAVCGVTVIAQTPQAESGKSLAIPSAGAKPSVPAPVRKVEAQAQLDRTALWIGDRLTYTIELTCQPGVDILADDLTPDKLRLDGLKILGNDTDRRVEPGDVTAYRFRYYLTTYSVDAPTLTIGALDIRYYVQRPGQRLEDTAPAGDVEVPPRGSCGPQRPSGKSEDLRNSRRPASRRAVAPVHDTSAHWHRFGFDLHRARVVFCRRTRAEFSEARAPVSAPSPGCGTGIASISAVARPHNGRGTPRSVRPGKLTGARSLA